MATAPSEMVVGAHRNSAYCIALGAPPLSWATLIESMKIQFLLAEPSPGGVEILTRNLGAEFVRRGHGCHMTFVSEAAMTSGCTDFEREFLASLGDLGISYGILGHSVRRNVFAGAARLRAEVAKFKPDVLHTHLGFGLLFQSLALLNLPTVYSHHTVEASFPSALFKLFDRFVDRYIAICGPVMDFLRPRVARPVELIPNGVPHDFAAHVRDRSLPKDPYLLSIGNLAPRKDYPTLIEAAALVVPAMAAQGRSVRFGIAGEGQEQAHLRALVVKKGLDTAFEFLGARSDVESLVDRADLLVNSSVLEGLPLALIEGTMAGLPIVATDVGGTRDIVTHQENGLIVPPRRPDMLAAAIVELLSDPDRYVAMARAGRQRSTRFTLDKCADAHLRLYATVLADRAVRSSAATLTAAD